MIERLTEAVECLSQALEEKLTSLGRLCKYLFGAPTETAKNILKERQEEESPAEEAVKSDADNPAADPEPKKKPPKGHGRLPADAYKGGKKIQITLPELKSGDACPCGCKGKLYELALPSVHVQFVGQPPLQANVYERTQLRCNLCGKVYAPELPPEAGAGEKYTDSAAAMVAILKYGCGLPFHRLERLQANLANPLPASTQWDIVNAAAISLAPVFDAFIVMAAQGQIIHNDDTTMKVLAFLKEQDPQSSRKGIFTTGILCQCGEHKIALFMTGHQHAGENLTELLEKRNAALAPPIQMCDALSRNVSKEFETILANCLTHARRQFVELIDRFPDDCTHVIEQIGAVYHHDAVAKEQKMTPDERLVHHQQNSRPLMEALQTWCTRQFEEKNVEPNSGMGKAINYLLKHWSKLTRFLEVPGAPLDNNICERALKFAILHRKNALFYKTARGAQVGDMFMSLIHTCQLAGVNPLNYITWLLQNVGRLAKTPGDYFPWNYPLTG